MCGYRSEWAFFEFFIALLSLGTRVIIKNRRSRRELTEIWTLNKNSTISVRSLGTSALGILVNLTSQSLSTSTPPFLILATAVINNTETPTKQQKRILLSSKKTSNLMASRPTVRSLPSILIGTGPRRPVCGY